MAAPSVTVNLFELSVFNPQVTAPIIGFVGPATKGPLNALTEVTDVGNAKSLFGVPTNRNYYSQRSLIRYLERGANGRFNRIAGPNVKAATLTLLAADGTPILALTANSLGTWANDDLSVAVLHNGTASYNIQVFFRGQPVEEFVGIDNGIVASRINNGSNRMTAVLLPGAGATFPDETVNPITQAVESLPFSGGNDGALATTDSAQSSTSGVAGRRFYGTMDAIAGSRTWEKILDIGASIASLSEVYGSVGMPVTPGTFSIRVQTGVAPTYVELADDGDESYAPGGAGVGLLIPSAGGHRGFIVYRTGQWGVQLSSGSTFLGGTIDGIWVRANTESVGATARGLGAYAGQLSSAPMALGHFNANRVVLTVPIDEQVGDVPLGPAGASSSDPALKTLAGWIVPGTVVLTPSHPTDPVPPAIWDDGFGGFRTGPLGTGVAVAGATIDYRTGAWSVPTWDPVGAVSFPGVTPAQLQAQYDIHLLDMGGGAVAGPNGTYENDEVVQNSDAGGDALAASTDPGAQNAAGPILPGTVKLVISDVGGSPETWYDDGVGGWLDRPRGDPRAAAAAGGSIDYTTGAWSITASGVIALGAVITLDYVSAAGDKARRALRGTGPQFIADVTPNAAGVNLDEPSSADSFNGPNWLDHRTGAFAFELDLVEAGTNTFNVRDNGTLSAVYTPASILGFGDGSETTFVGTLQGAPFRREDNRLVGFQGAQASAAGTGEPQATFANADTDPDDDHWLQNVVLPSDPDNFLNFRNGQASIQWTSAPLAEEAVYVVAEEIVVHFEAQHPGDIGNERPVLTDGFFVDVGADPTLAGTIRARVWFGSNQEESFGQAADLDELVNDINDPVNGSRLITADLTDAGVSLPPDLTAVQQCGLSGAFTVADVIGTKTGQVYTGLQVFRNHEVVDVDFISVPGQWHRQVIIALQTLVERKGRNAICIVPVPDFDDPFTYRDFFNGSYNAAVPGGTARPTVLVPFPPLVEINSRHLTNATPWLLNFDQDNNVSKFEPPEGDFGRLIAKTPAPWLPVAGLRRGQVLSEQVRYSAAKEDRDLIQGLVGNRVEVVNTIIRISGLGLHLYEQQTMTRKPGSFLSRLSVSWTMNLIMNRLGLVAREFQFELNGPVLWREATARLNAVLQPIIERQGLVDAHVLVDATTVTPADIDAFRMPGKIFVKPSLDVRDVEFDLILTPQGADFSEVVVG